MTCYRRCVETEDRKDAKPSTLEGFFALTTRAFTAYPGHCAGSLLVYPRLRRTSPW